MDTNNTARTISTDATAAPRLELRWNLRHTVGRASTLVGEWIVVGGDEEQRLAA